MDRTYNVEVHIYGTMKSKKMREKAKRTKIYTIVANNEKDAGYKAMENIWNEKRENPEEFKGCLFGIDVQKIKPLSEVI